MLGQELETRSVCHIVLVQLAQHLGINGITTASTTRSTPKMICINPALAILGILLENAERSSMSKFSIALAGFLLSATGAAAQDVDLGAELYDLHCAVCHGLEAKGGGPLAPALLLQPPSLRDMTARHGAFPTARIVRRIDGRDPLVSHGSPMPVYGEFFEGEDVVIKNQAGQPIMTSKPIVDLLEYLKTIQE